MSIPLIPDELPFSAEEVRSALRRWLPERDADEAADAIIESAASYMEACLERSEELRRAGHEPPGRSSGFVVPEALLVNLALLSDSAADRVGALMERRWAVLRASRIERERRRAAERAGLRPTIDEVLDAAERRGELSWDDPKVFRGLAVDVPALPPLPEPTPEVIAAAEAYVTEEIRSWEQLLDTARRGEPLPEPEPNGIEDIDAADAEATLPGSAPDWAFLDDYLLRWDRHLRGEEKLFGGLARELTRFNGELVRALRVNPKRSVPRAIMFPLLRGGGSGAIPVDGPVGVALREALGESAMPHTTWLAGEFYAAADLLEWWEANREGYEPFPFFDEWRARALTRREVAFMRLMRDRYDEIFPDQP
ncbi:MAG TPA: hypothetical protein VIQ74_08685 [Gemmatimonadaceae bacterium]